MVVRDYYYAHLYVCVCVMEGLKLKKRRGGGVRKEENR